MRHPAVVNAQQSTVCVGFGVIQGFQTIRKRKKMPDLCLEERMNTLFFNSRRQGITSRVDECNLYEKMANMIHAVSTTTRKLIRANKEEAQTVQQQRCDT